MIRLRGISLKSIRLNHALRTPSIDLDKLRFVTKQPDPFDVEKFSLIIPNCPKKRVQLITRPALHGIYCTIGLIIPTGSRNTANLPSGICHLDEKLAYGPTTHTFASRADVARFLDESGAICDSQTDQETTFMALSIKRDHIAEGVKLLIETAFQPHITPEAVSEAFENVENEVKYLQYEKIRDKEILELTIEAGFNQDTLGVPRSIPDEKFEGFQVQTWMDAILQHRRENYLSRDPIFIGIGVKMEELGKAVNLNMPMISKPSWAPAGAPESQTVPVSENESETQVSVIDKAPKKELVLPHEAKWTGGWAHRASNSQSFSIGDIEEESYFSIGWKAPGYDQPGRPYQTISTVLVESSDRQRYVCHVLRALLGGGSAFESGGPGKGIQSKLYKDVLATHEGQNFSHFKAHYKEFAEVGIFMIYGTGPPNYMRQGVDIALRMMRSIAKGDTTGADLERAKTQLTNQYLRDLEIRAEMMESFGRETVAYGRPVDPTHTINKIRKVSKSDIQQMANYLLQYDPAIAILGDVNDSSLYDDARTAQRKGVPLIGKLTMMTSSITGAMKRFITDRR